MAASSWLMITEAERRFQVRIKVGVPAGGLGERLNQMHVGLDKNCGADGWVMTCRVPRRRQRRGRDLLPRPDPRRRDEASGNTVAIADAWISWARQRYAW
jgi:hypothetical protein